MNLINPRHVGGGLQYLVGLCVCMSAVTNQWTGLLDWTGLTSSAIFTNQDTNIIYTHFASH